MVWLYDNLGGNLNLCSLNKNNAMLGVGRTEVKRVGLQRIITEICCGQEAVKREGHPLNWGMVCPLIFKNKKSVPFSQYASTINLSFN